MAAGPTAQGGAGTRFPFHSEFITALVIIKTSGYVVLFTTRPPSPLPATWVLQPSFAWWLAGLPNAVVSRPASYQALHPMSGCDITGGRKFVSLPHPGIEQRCGSAQISATLLILRWALCLTRFDLGPPFCSAGHEFKKLRCPPLGGIAARFDFSHPPPFSWALVIINTSGYVV